jgi:hypothetical protein
VRARFLVMIFIPRNDQTPQHAQPSTPQNDSDRRLAIASTTRPWTAHASTPLQVMTMRC